MEDGQAQYLDAAVRIINLMRNTYGNYFKQYYEGDPIQIPKSNFPCVIVEKVASQVSLSATGTDELRSQVNIRVVMDKSDDFGKNDNVDLTDRKLRQLVEGRDSVTGNYQPSTVLYTIRKNITLGNVNLDMNMDVRYDIQPRSDMVVTNESLISVLTTERILVGDRT